MKKIYLITFLVCIFSLANAQVSKKKQKKTKESATTTMEADTIFPVSNKNDKPVIEEKKSKSSKKQQKVESEKEVKTKKGKEETPKQEVKTKKSKEKKQKPQKIAETPKLSIKNEVDEADISKRTLFELGFRAAGNYLQPKMTAFSTPQLSSSGLPIVKNGQIQRDAFSVSTEPQFGGTTGLFWRASKGNFFFQTELLGALKGGIIQNSNVNNPSIDARFISLDMPLIFGLRSKELRIYTGPIASYPIQYQTKLIDALKSYTLAELPKTAFKQYGVNYQFGLGYDIGSWEIDARYEFGILPIAEQQLGTINLPNTFKMNSGLFQFSIGKTFWNRVR